MGSLVLIGPQGQIVCERCELADGPLGRMRGLSGRTRLPRGRGILMRPTWFVHTAFMRFPVDVIFLDRDLTVLAVPGVPPGTCAPSPCSSSQPGNQQRSASGSATDLLGDPCP